METYRKNFHGHDIEKMKKGFRMKSLLFALLIVATGVLLLLKNSGMLSNEVADMIFSWQMLIIAIGFINLFGRGWFFGIILMLVGGFFLLSESSLISYQFKDAFWPAILIIGGIGLIFSAVGVFKCKSNNPFVIPAGSSDNDHIEDLLVFGGNERIIHSNSFKGGKITAVFGGSKVDLSKATLAEGNQEIEVVTIFGGAEIIVPSEWNIKLEVLNIFGGFVDKRRNDQVDLSKTLVIKGVAIFGGGEVKNYY
jgi:predicted membrane protein